MKTSVSSQSGTDKEMMTSHEQEYKKLLTGSLGIYRGALRNGKTQETALELASQHLQHQVFLEVMQANKK